MCTLVPETTRGCQKTNLYGVHTTYLYSYQEMVQNKSSVKIYAVSIFPKQKKETKKKNLGAHCMIK